MKRTLRRNLPNIRHNKSMKKCQADKNVNKSKELETLKTNDTVRIRFQGIWNKKGRLVKKLNEPRSYLVKKTEGNYFRRNRRHLLKTNEKQARNTTSTQVDYENIFNEQESQTKHSKQEQHSQNYNQTRRGKIVRLPAKYRE